MANPKSREQRAERERARLYQARRDFHAGISRRRVRDNLIAGIAGGILILAVVGGQVAYYTLGPGVPAPSSSPSPTATPSIPAP
ncbi:dioxygenase [Microbacterium sp. cx-55]|uniref:dioxygenase n=1 Tax=unclassified Microbacterium TaxID=2609290 RepID=UPI001CC11729|nr:MULTISPECIES: dioxygenase [unclassified Microbacterium]MBZ4486372.1 dioxygenase [Microbacterium sp. cx-55]MCC4907344.1 dioxygenase [Microbacterium sp. cx-59]UGB33790.1 dioxygenase [Microbacterium sp. cx-55]